MAKIILKVEGRPDQEFLIKDRLTIGRKKDNDIVITDTLSSRQHAQVVKSGGLYKVRDLGSHNGTFLNGVKISETVLKEGDVITIGAVQLFFEKAPIDDMLGERIGGYKIMERLGEGGMGKVYKARQISMDRIVALKVLSEKVTADTSYIKAFIQEAKVAGQLNHNNVVNVHDFGRTEEGTYFLSMEYVDGDDIQGILEKKGKLSTEQSVLVISQVAAALEYAHRNSIIHSDIKPQNIMLDKSGTVKLADLGLAKYYGKGTFDSDPDIVMGTPFYMSPEQATKSKVDGRTDIYSLGATFFHMITGRPPFDGDSALAILTKHVTEAVPSPRKYDVTISNQIAKLIQWMMEKNPDDRPSTMQALIDKLNELKGMEQNRSAAHTARRGYAADVKRAMASRRKVASRRRALSKTVPGVALIVIAVIAALFLFKNMNGPQAQPRPPAPRPVPPAPSPGTDHGGVTPPEVPDDQPVVTLSGADFDFKGVGQQDHFAPLGAGGWQGWNFDYMQGFVESPGQGNTGFKYKGARYDSTSFKGEVTIEFTDSRGSFSFYLEGEGYKNSLGVHVTDEIILYAPGKKERYDFKRPVGTEVTFRIDTRSEGYAAFFGGGREIGRIQLGETGFKGAAHVRIDGTRVRIHHFKTGTSH